MTERVSAKSKHIRIAQHLLTLLLLALIGILLFAHFDKSALEKKNRSLQAVASQSAAKPPSSNPASGEPVSGEPVSSEPASGEPVSGEPVPSEILPQFQELIKINDELVGWLEIEGTSLSLPVVQGEDNEFYLTHDFYDGEDKYGTVFADYSSDLTQERANTILYGHRTSTKSMFGALEDYRDQAFFEQHKVLRFDSLYQEREYEIMAVFLSRVYNSDDEVFKYYDYKQISSKEEFDTYCKNISELSLVSTDVTAEYGDELLTLSTCDDTVEDGRLVVVAKRR